MVEGMCLFVRRKTASCRRALNARRLMCGMACVAWFRCALDVCLIGVHLYPRPSADVRLSLPVHVMSC
jgi:hypothetical protein